MGASGIWRRFMRAIVVTVVLIVEATYALGAPISMAPMPPPRPHLLRNRWYSAKTVYRHQGTTRRAPSTRTKIINRTNAPAALGW
jgi:hypothetical protein